VSERRRIVLGATLAGVPGQGGAAWAVLQWALGLRRLGHEVVLVEQVEPGRFSDTAPAFDALTRAYGVRAALIDGAGAAAGLSRFELRRAVTGADLLLNLSGVLRDDRVLAGAARRVFVDLDPAFTQLWHTAEGIDLGLDRHEAFVTVGGCVGRAGCEVPTCGRQWIPTPPPVVLEHWPLAGGTGGGRLTTVAHWRSYGSIHHDGVHYGQKAHSLRPLLGLPAATGAAFRLALGIHPEERDDLAALRRDGWELVDPVRAAGTPGAYQAFVQGSWAEFGLAKLGYVQARCGWFSDRSVCYLASGRPVVAQDTGFGAWLPAGDGVFAFHDADGVTAAVESLRTDYGRHRRAARELAEEVFRADRVLVPLLDRLAETVSCA
jgi:hypothetical protein